MSTARPSSGSAAGAATMRARAGRALAAAALAAVLGISGAAYRDPDLILSLAAVAIFCN